MNFELRHKNAGYNIKNEKLDINKENDYIIIQSIIDSYNGDIRFNIKDGKFYFK